jgi:hypothetical protein
MGRRGEKSKSRESGSNRANSDTLSEFSHVSFFLFFLKIDEIGMKCHTMLRS